MEVMAVGEVDDGALAAVEEGVQRVFRLPVRRAPGAPEPSAALDEARRQYDSTGILKTVRERRSPGAARILGVTEVDLFIPMLTFVFGQAQLGGCAALISLARLRQEFYGLPADRPLLLERAVKEALHELGHTFGLTHCTDDACAISLSTNIRHVDAKNGGFCRGCAALLAERLPAGGPGDGPAGTRESDP
jgi:archaemetzincin